MFIVNLTYVKSLAEVEKHLGEHICFLDKYYAIEKFICSGRKDPRTGGIIICNVENAEEMNQILSEDPFKKNHIADYEVIEFYPTKYADSFKVFVDKGEK